MFARLVNRSAAAGFPWWGLVVAAALACAVWIALEAFRIHRRNNRHRRLARYFRHVEAGDERSTAGKDAGP